MTRTEGVSRVPTTFQVRAQHLVLKTVGAGTEVALLRATYPRLPTNGSYTSDDLEAAEADLLDCGLLTIENGRVVPTALGRSAVILADRDFEEVALLMALQAHPPLWLSIAADDDQIRPELIPDEEAARLSSYSLDPDARDALLIAAGRRFDPSKTSDIGMAGELCVVESCRQALIDNGLDEAAESVLHVSQFSDQLGYDVKSPSVTGGVRRMEVKTCSTRRESFRIEISRNEADYGQKDPSWVLVVCRYSEGAAELVGWCPFELLAPQLPVDSGSGRWSSAQFTLEIDQLQPGLPIAQDGQ